MTGSNSKWLVGCCIGCAVLIMGSAAVGYFGVRKVVREFDTAETVGREVSSRFGEGEDFTPSADGTIAPERIEVFLEIRETTAPERAELEASLGRLAKGAEGSPDGVIGTIRSALGMLPKMARYIGRRNQIFLDRGMGPGEYLYLYSVAYFSWLGHPSEDGPPFMLVEEEGQAGVRAGDNEAVLAQRGENIRRLLNRQLLPVLENQLAALGLAEETDPDGGWREALVGEVAAMEADPLRLPWQDGVPEVIRGSLEPYRERFEKSYSALCNPVEVGIGHR